MFVQIQPRETKADNSL
jgi:hypothetical protein